MQATLCHNMHRLQLLHADATGIKHTACRRCTRLGVVVARQRHMVEQPQQLRRVAQVGCLTPHQKEQPQLCKMPHPRASSRHAHKRAAGAAGAGTTATCCCRLAAALLRRRRSAAAMCLPCSSPSPAVAVRDLAQAAVQKLNVSLPLPLVVGTLSKVGVVQPRYCCLERVRRKRVCGASAGAAA